jgi:hypothetical protein
MCDIWRITPIMSLTQMRCEQTASVANNSRLASELYAFLE